MKNDIPEDIYTEIMRLFPEKNIQSKVIELIESLWDTLLNVSAHQLARSVLVISKGDFSTLKNIYNDNFFGDPRDIISRAEDILGNPKHYLTKAFPYD